MDSRTKLLKEHKTPEYHRVRQLLTLNVLYIVLGLGFYVDLPLIVVELARHPVAYLVYLFMFFGSFAFLVWFAVDYYQEWLPAERAFLERETGWRPGYVYYLGAIPILGVLFLGGYLLRRKSALLASGADGVRMTWFERRAAPAATGRTCEETYDVEEGEGCWRCGYTGSDDFCERCGSSMNPNKRYLYAAWTAGILMSGGHFILAFTELLVTSTSPELVVYSIFVGSISIVFLPPVMRYIRREIKPISRGDYIWLFVIVFLVNEYILRVYM